VAEDLAAERLPKVADAAPAKREARRAAYRGRFLAAYLVLGVVAGIAGAGAIVLFTGAERAGSSDWAEWQPVGSESTYAQQIADHVGRRYRLPGGDQIVGVVAGPPQVQGVSVEAVAIEAPNATSTDDIEVVRTEDSFMYLLCGLGDACAVREGRPTEERHRFLRRQALELSLYTFTYLDVDSVIVLLPPPAADQTANATALFLERKDFRFELGQPLAETISDPEAAALIEVPEQETVKVDRLTRPFLFKYEFQPLQNQTAVLLLSPPETSE
jgi:hypothetical protein